MLETGGQQKTQICLKRVRSSQGQYMLREKLSQAQLYNQTTRCNESLIEYVFIQTNCILGINTVVVTNEIRKKASLRIMMR